MRVAVKSFPAWRMVPRMRGLGDVPSDAAPGGLVVRHRDVLLASVLADRAYHRHVKYVVIRDGEGGPELRLPVPRDYNGHPYLAGGRAEILAGGMIQVEDNQFTFTNETTHFQTGPAQEAILRLMCDALGINYRVDFPLEGREPDLFIDVDCSRVLMPPDQ